MSDSLWPHGLNSSWNSPGQNTGCGWPFPSPRDLPNPGVEPKSPTLQTDSLPAEPQGKSRILEWVAYPFSRGSSQPGNWTGVSCIAGGFFFYQLSYEGSPLRAEVLHKVRSTPVPEVRGPGWSHPPAARKPYPPGPAKEAAGVPRPGPALTRLG